MIFKTASGRVWVPVGHWYKSLTDFLNLFDFKHLDLWTSSRFHMSKGMPHFNSNLLFLFYLFWSDCHFHNYSNSLFWILILHKLLVTCFLAVGTFPQATETTVLCLASPTSISGYTASNPNYFYISLIHLMKKRNFSFPNLPRVVQRLYEHAGRPTPTVFHPYDIEMGGGEKSMSFSNFLGTSCSSGRRLFLSHGKYEVSEFWV